MSRKPFNRRTGTNKPKLAMSEKEFYRLSDEISEIAAAITRDLLDGRITAAEAKRRQRKADENRKRMRQAIKGLKVGP
jgi:hypothetical protein